MKKITVFFFLFFFITISSFCQSNIYLFAGGNANKTKIKYPDGGGNHINDLSYGQRKGVHAGVRYTRSFNSFINYGADALYILKGFKNPILGNKDYHYVGLTPFGELIMFNRTEGNKANRLSIGLGLNMGYLVSHNDDRGDTHKYKVDLNFKFNSTYYFKRVGLEIFYLHQLWPYNSLASLEVFQRTAGFSLLYKLK